MMASASDDDDNEGINGFSQLDISDGENDSGFGDSEDEEEEEYEIDIDGPQPTTTTSKTTLDQGDSSSATTSAIPADRVSISWKDAPKMRKIMPSLGLRPPHGRGCKRNPNASLEEDTSGKLYRQILTAGRKSGALPSVQLDKGKAKQRALMDTTLGGMERVATRAAADVLGLPTPLVDLAGLKNISDGGYMDRQKKLELLRDDTDWVKHDIRFNYTKTVQMDDDDPEDIYITLESEKDLCSYLGWYYRSSFQLAFMWKDIKQMVDVFALYDLDITTIDWPKEIRNQDIYGGVFVMLASKVDALLEHLEDNLAFTWEALESDMISSDCLCTQFEEDQFKGVISLLCGAKGGAQVPPPLLFLDLQQMLSADEDRWHSVAEVLQPMIDDYAVALHLYMTLDDLLGPNTNLSDVVDLAQALQMPSSNNDGRRYLLDAIEDFDFKMSYEASDPIDTLDTRKLWRDFQAALRRSPKPSEFHTTFKVPKPEDSFPEWRAPQSNRGGYNRKDTSQCSCGRNHAHDHGVLPEVPLSVLREHFGKGLDDHTLMAMYEETMLDLAKRMSLGEKIDGKALLGDGRSYSDDEEDYDEGGIQDVWNKTFMGSSSYRLPRPAASIEEIYDKPKKKRVNRAPEMLKLIIAEKAAKAAKEAAEGSPSTPSKPRPLRKQRSQSSLEPDFSIPVSTEGHVTSGHAYRKANNLGPIREPRAGPAPVMTKPVVEEEEEDAGHPVYRLNSRQLRCMESLLEEDVVGQGGVREVRWNILLRAFEKIGFRVESTEGHNNFKFVPPDPKLPIIIEPRPRDKPVLDKRAVKSLGDKLKNEYGWTAEWFTSKGASEDD